MSPHIARGSPPWAWWAPHGAAGAAEAGANCGGAEAAAGAKGAACGAAAEATSRQVLGWAKALRPNGVPCATGVIKGRRGGGVVGRSELAGRSGITDCSGALARSAIAGCSAGAGCSGAA
jgi:hypothetical protein